MSLLLVVGLVVLLLQEAKQADKAAKQEAARQRRAQRLVACCLLSGSCTMQHALRISVLLVGNWGRFKMQTQCVKTSACSTQRCPAVCSVVLCCAVQGC
jgi:hypothetical protein